jgi:NDP-sugar pyrophosphorylase family protein
MAGGRGERLRPITDAMPKPMVRVAGRPILERIVLHLVGFGFRRVFVSVNYMSDVITEYFGDGSRFGCRIEYLHETEPLGTAGALSLLPDLAEHPILVLNGDLLTQADLGALLRFHERYSLKATVGVREYVHNIPFGVIEMDGHRVVGLSEKPTQVWLANAGIYCIDPDLPQRTPQRAFFNMPDLVADCLDQSEPVGGFLIEGDWVDVGRLDELRRARGEDASE